jgi:hypothetical protein
VKIERNNFSDPIKELKNFFHTIKELSSVSKVKIILSELNQETLTEILIENYSEKNIKGTLELSVEKLVFWNCGFMKVKFDGNPLAELYDIKEAECKKIDGVQTLNMPSICTPIPSKKKAIQTLGPKRIAS